MICLFSIVQFYRTKLGSTFCLPAPWHCRPTNWIAPVIREALTNHMTGNKMIQWIEQTAQVSEPVCFNWCYIKYLCVSGDNLWRLDQIDALPRKVSDVFPNLPSNIDGAFSTQDKIYFFKVYISDHLMQCPLSKTAVSHQIGGLHPFILLDEYVTQ